MIILKHKWSGNFEIQVNGKPVGTIYKEGYQKFMSEFMRMVAFPETSQVFRDMLKALEKVLEENNMPEGSFNCPVCYRRLDISPHKGWCWWGDAVEAVKKARNENV